jgi:CRP/FNR family transcriptional regulator/CRP/FNR family cyclic AMP-dependent transcriptional regulator
MRSVLDKVLVLRSVELFQALSAEELYPVAEIALTESFAPSETIVEQGEAAEDLFVVIDGECEVLKDGAVVSTMSGGQAFGELSVLDAEPRAATVRAKTPAELLRIPRSEFEALLDESPELAKGVIRALLGYVRRK